VTRIPKSLGRDRQDFGTFSSTNTTRSTDKVWHVIETDIPALKRELGKK
jgi:uncharacterized protein with HEPN domain